MKSWPLNVRSSWPSAGPATRTPTIAARETIIAMAAALCLIIVLLLHESADEFPVGRVGMVAPADGVGADQPPACRHDHRIAVVLGGFENLPDDLHTQRPV